MITKRQILEQFAPKKGFENVAYRYMNEDDLDVIEDIIPDVFYRLGNTDYVMDEILSTSDIDISIVAEVNDEIAGFLFLGNAQIPNVVSDIFSREEYNELRSKNGIQGVALGVNPKFKGYNIGLGLLRFFKGNTNVDYMWGMQLTALENINFWKRRSKLFYDNGYLRMTYAYLK